MPPTSDNLPALLRRLADGIDAGIVTLGPFYVNIVRPEASGLGLSASLDESFRQFQSGETMYLTLNLKCSWYSNNWTAIVPS